MKLFLIIKPDLYLIFDRTYSSIDPILINPNYIPPYLCLTFDYHFLNHSYSHYRSKEYILDSKGKKLS